MRRTYSSLTLTSGVIVVLVASTIATGGRALLAASQQEHGRQSSQESSARDDALEALKEQVAALNTKVLGLELRLLRSTVDISMLQSRNKSASLDPASPKLYQRLDSDEGFFLVSLQDATAYLDGYRVALDLGNLTSATYVGFTLSATWGPRLDIENPTAASYQRWEGERRTRQFSFTERLLPSTWNRVELVLPSTTGGQLGFIEVKIETNTVSMSTGG